MAINPAQQMTSVAFIDGSLTDLQTILSELETPKRRKQKTCSVLPEREASIYI